MADFAILYHAAHQGIGVVCDMESLGCKAGRKAGRTQHPYRVFREGGGNVPQQAVIQIVHPLVRIDQFTIRGFGHGVYGQVTTQQILLKGGSRVRAGFKTGITVTRLAFGACQCVLFLALRVQEYGEVPAYRLITQRQHVLWRCADHNPVAFLYRQPESCVPYCTADQVNLHCGLNLTSDVGTGDENHRTVHVHCGPQGKPERRRQSGLV